MFPVVSGLRVRVSARRLGSSIDTFEPERSLEARVSDATLTRVEDEDDNPLSDEEVSARYSGRITAAPRATGAHSGSDQPL